MDTLENEILELRETVKKLKEEYSPQTVSAIWKDVYSHCLLVNLYHTHENAEKYLVDTYGSLENATNYGYSISKVNIL